MGARLKPQSAAAAEQFQAELAARLGLRGPGGPGVAESVTSWLASQAESGGGLRAWRRAFVASYGFCLPSRELLDLLASRRRPVVGVGAGTGYLEAWLNRYGVPALATDQFPGAANGYRFRAAEPWPVLQQEAAAAIAAHPAHLVLMSWPCRHVEWGVNAAAACRPGQELLVVGELDGCTGTPALEALLATGFALLTTAPVGNWPCIADCARLFRRR